jgi:hypothetical protein
MVVEFLIISKEKMDETKRRRIIAMINTTKQPDKMHIFLKNVVVTSNPSQKNLVGVAA